MYTCNATKIEAGNNFTHVEECEVTDEQAPGNIGCRDQMRGMHKCDWVQSSQWVTLVDLSV